MWWQARQHYVACNINPSHKPHFLTASVGRSRVKKIYVFALSKCKSSASHIPPLTLSCCCCSKVVASLPAVKLIFDKPCTRLFGELQKTSSSTSCLMFGGFCCCYRFVLSSHAYMQLSLSLLLTSRLLPLFPSFDLPLLHKKVYLKNTHTKIMTRCYGYLFAKNWSLIHANVVTLGGIYLCNI